MSTRCQIRIEGNKALLYIHSDGYPEGILPTLLPFVAKFMAERGPDPEYMAARILQQFMNKADKRTEEHYKQFPQFPAHLHNSYIGFGVDVGLHGDIAYLYDVKKNGTVEVRRSRGFGDDQGFIVKGSFPVGTLPESALALLKTGEDEE